MRRAERSGRQRGEQKQTTIIRTRGISSGGSQTTRPNSGAGRGILWDAGPGAIEYVAHRSNGITTLFFTILLDDVVLHPPSHPISARAILR